MKKVKPAPAPRRSASAMRAYAVVIAAALALTACSDDGDGPADPPKKVPYEWSLDLDLGDGVALQGLKRDTSVEATVPDTISGKVIGLDTSLVQDTLRFRNVEYDDFHVSAPLASDGSFRFEAVDLLGGLDGSMTILIWLKGKAADRPPAPDTVNLDLDRPCAPGQC